MGTITPERQDIFEEEVSYRAAISEATNFKLGASINFINRFQTDSKVWEVNGPYSSALNTTGVDGVYDCQQNMEIYGIFMYNLIPGTSGNTEFNIRKHTASNQAGSTIFATRPRLSYLSGINSGLSKRFYDNVILQNPSGSIQPILVSTSLNAGDFLTCDLTASQFGGQNAGIRIHLRPR